MPTVSVLIVDDHTLLRHALRRILEADPDVLIAGEAADGHAALTLAESLRPAVVLMDIGLPVLNGIEATRELVRRAYRTAVLMLTMHADRGYVRSSLRAGARGFVLKDAEGLDVVRAVKTVAAGGSYFSPTIARVVEEHALASNTVEAAPVSRLTGRERQVLQLIAEGRSNKEAAVVLDLGVSTVETHRKSLMEKLALHNTADLVRFAIRHGVIAQ